jgi:hypothetical protein
MKRLPLLLFVSVLAILLGCNETSLTENKELAEAKTNSTYFNGSINGEFIEGGGLAFLKKDSSLHLRGLMGTKGGHHQIDIVIKNPTAGKYILDTLDTNASISRVVGMDAIDHIYKPNSNDSSYISFNIDEDQSKTSGEIVFLGHCSDYKLEISLHGTFDIMIGKFGYNIWSCDYDENGISNCRFLE